MQFILSKPESDWQMNQNSAPSLGASLDTAVGTSEAAGSGLLSRLLSSSVLAAALIFPFWPVAASDGFDEVSQGRRFQVSAMRQVDHGDDDDDLQGRRYYTNNQNRVWLNDSARASQLRSNNRNNYTSGWLGAPVILNGSATNQWRADRWDSRLDNRLRYRTYNSYRNDWNRQRSYLSTNLPRYTQISRLTQAEQNALNNQMRTAYLSYNGNDYNAPTTWTNYTDPQFLDYLRTEQPTVLQGLLSSIGLGSNDNYLYSSNWNNERSQLSQNMSRIHTLALNGRITSAQEQDLLSRLRAEYSGYNSQSAGNLGWNQYSDPNFVDYLNNNRPSLLSTVRDYLVR
ncbi:MAG: hypothetical protein HY986_02925 [Candidatus Melainabacteria bacterium]|nr:hypothetical protein [Candidatus Melainabacteria bacterium]